MNNKVIALLVLIALAVITLLLNTRVTEFRLLFWKIEMSLAILVLITLMIGFVLGYVVAKLTGRKPGQQSVAEG
jgi:uncharacterized integral membrane protein